MIACNWKYPVDIQYHELIDPLKVVVNGLSHKLNVLVPDLKGILVEFDESSIQLMNKDGHCFDSDGSKAPIVDVHPELPFLRMHALVSVHVYRLKVNSLMNVKVENEFSKNYICRSQIYKMVFVKINKVNGNFAEAEDGVEPIKLEKGMNIEIKVKSVSIDATRVKVSGIFVSLQNTFKEEKKSINLDVDDATKPDVVTLEKKKKKQKKIKIEEDHEIATQLNDSSNEALIKIDEDSVKRERKRKKKKDKEKENFESPCLPNKRIKLDPDELPKKSEVDDIWTDED